MPIFLFIMPLFYELYFVCDNGGTFDESRHFSLYRFDLLFKQLNAKMYFIYAFIYCRIKPKKKIQNNKRCHKIFSYNLLQCIGKSLSSQLYVGLLMVGSQLRVGIISRQSIFISRCTFVTLSRIYRVRKFYKQYGNNTLIIHLEFKLWRSSHNILELSHV